MSKFESVEEAKKFLNEIENNYKAFTDEAYNLQEEINKTKQEIQAIDNLCDELRNSNYLLWSQSTIQDQQVQEIEENQPDINTIIEGIDLKWQNQN